MERFYGYGIVSKDCRPMAVGAVRDKDEAMEVRDALNESIYKPHGPFRVVELFYKDEQS